MLKVVAADAGRVGTAVQVASAAKPAASAATPVRIAALWVIPGSPASSRWIPVSAHSTGREKYVNGVNKMFL
jgi:hypothetical protein